MANTVCFVVAFLALVSLAFGQESKNGFYFVKLLFNINNL
jgi:hypothetical protein